MVRRTRSSSRLLTAVWVVIALLCLTSDISRAQSVGTQCSEPRVRKSWVSLSDTEKQLYKDAVSEAMNQGFYQKFVQIHVDTVSGLEAHSTCVFTYWHRMLLLGYENMLRSLGDEFQCITVPYWDHLSSTANLASGSCSNLENCSPIVADFGGTSQGYRKSVSVYDQVLPATRDTLCVNREPLNNFCGNNSACAGCVPRNRYMKYTPYPSEASFASVYQQVFTHNDSISYNLAVEQGIHNAVHSYTGATMAYFAAPVDPLFYSHHALVDLLQTIYLKCQNGAEDVTLSETTKSTDPVFWGSCTRRDSSATFNALDPVMMRVTAFDGSTFVHVREDPNNILYPFFKDLPATYGEYVDAKDLGEYSYTYEMSGGLASMYQECRASNSLTAATATTLLGQEHATYGKKSKGKKSKGNKNHKGKQGKHKGRSSDDEEEDDAETDQGYNSIGDTLANGKAYGQAYGQTDEEADGDETDEVESVDDVDVGGEREVVYPEPVLEPSSEADSAMQRWAIALFEAGRISGYEEKGAREQMEMITCQHNADCMGGVQDFTDLFRQNFGVSGHTRCYSIVQDLMAGKRVIGIPKWREITDRFLPCNEPEPLEDEKAAAIEADEEEEAQLGQGDSAYVSAF